MAFSHTEIFDLVGRRQLKPVSYNRDSATGDEFARIDLCVPCWLVAIALLALRVAVPLWGWLLLAFLSGWIIETADRKPRKTDPNDAGNRKKVRRMAEDA